MASDSPDATRADSEKPSLRELWRAADPSLRAVKSEYYFDFYEELFSHLRDAPLKILEVGVYKGGSTLLFAKYFSGARILGVDLTEPPRDFYEEVAGNGLSDRVRVALVSQADERGLYYAIDSYFGDELLDLVIDDASHMYLETRSTFETVFGSRLKPGGTYVIEDWGCGYWPMWEDGDPDGLHGLPLLVKELVDLVALSDRSMLRQGRRVLPVESELPSPISKAVLTRSLAAFVRSEAEMPSSSTWTTPLGAGVESSARASPEVAGHIEDLGLRDLLRQLPYATARALRTRFSGWTTPVEHRHGADGD